MRLRKLVAAAVPLPALLGLAVAVPAAAAAEPLVTLADSAAPLVNSARTGDVAAGQPITAALSLKLHNQQALEKFLADVQNPASPQYHHFMTPARFNAEFGPTQADVDKAVSFLEKAGATGIEVSGNRQAVTFSGSAAQLEAAFHTPLGTYHDQVSGRNFFANEIGRAHV